MNQRRYNLHVRIDIDKYRAQGMTQTICSEIF